MNTDNNNNNNTSSENNSGKTSSDNSERKSRKSKRKSHRKSTASGDVRKRSSRVPSTAFDPDEVPLGLSASSSSLPPLPVTVNYSDDVPLGMFQAARREEQEDSMPLGVMQMRKQDQDDSTPLAVVQQRKQDEEESTPLAVLSNRKSISGPGQPFDRRSSTGSSSSLYNRVPPQFGSAPPVPQIPNQQQNAYRMSSTPNFQSNPSAFRPPTMLPGNSQPNFRMSGMSPQSHPNHGGFVTKLTRKISGGLSPAHQSLDNRPLPMIPQQQRIMDSEVGGAQPPQLRRQKSLVRYDRARPRMNIHGRITATDAARFGSASPPPAFPITAPPPGFSNPAPANPRLPPQPPNAPISLKPPTIARPAQLPQSSYDYYKPVSTCRKAWVFFAKAITFFIPTFALTCCGKNTPTTQLAFREKLALCIIIFFLMFAVGFLTFAFNVVLCSPGRSTPMPAVSMDSGFIQIEQFAVPVFDYPHPNVDVPFGEIFDRPSRERDLTFMFQRVSGCEILFKERAREFLFPCTLNGVPKAQAGTLGEHCHQPAAHEVLDKMKKSGRARPVYYDWETVSSSSSLMVYNGLVLDWNRLDRLLPDVKPNDLANVNGINLAFIKRRYTQRDATFYLSQNATMKQVAGCLSNVARVGIMDAETIGCIASDIVLWISLIFIVGVVLIRFFMALIFSWYVARGLGKRLSNWEKQKFSEERKILEDLWSGGSSAQMGSSLTGSPSTQSKRKSLRGSYYQQQEWTGFKNLGGGNGKYPPSPRLSISTNNEDYSETSSIIKRRGSQGSHASSLISSLVKKDDDSGSLIMDVPKDGSKVSLSIPSTPASGASSINGDSQPNSPILASQQPPASPTSNPATPSDPWPQPGMFVNAAPEIMHTVMLVTCYSENESGIRTTLDSLAQTTYSDTHKLLFVIADGIVTGAGNSMSTPDILVSMLEPDSQFPGNPRPYSYVAIADGAKRHNMAQVYAGYYNSTNTNGTSHRVPMILIVKCGTPSEQDQPKPGNRGKRDSQLILMSFFQKVMFDERMTPLEYDLFQKITRVARVTPDKYEIVLMVDADTKVKTDSLERMVACMARDNTVMGLCGETRIANKWSSWVSAIQVFEYYISHHMAKAFESIFGGVTCLPGCFCCYRIKAPKGDQGYWVPILANPDIVEEYSENVVDTLHKKNLLLLGEDRYLTTLMLRTFPKRKMLFVPQAICHTVVPDTFKVLLSQRRRWINSTIHNLLELVLVRDLCGTFCISMQFVIFMELIGTLVLPAAICFTLYLIIISFFTDPVPVIPLLLLGAILGLPALLILFTSRKFSNVWWMVVYLLSLPIWNGVLPLYAFWNFDDFTWGETRKTAGVDSHNHGDAEGEFDSSKIIMKRYSEWELIKRRAIAQAQAQHQVQSQRQQEQMILQQRRDTGSFSGGSGVPPSGSPMLNGQFVPSSSSPGMPPSLPPYPGAQSSRPNQMGMVPENVQYYGPENMLVGREGEVVMDGKGWVPHTLGRSDQR